MFWILPNTDSDSLLLSKNIFFPSRPTYTHTYRQTRSGKIIFHESILEKFSSLEKYQVSGIVCIVEIAVDIEKWMRQQKCLMAGKRLDNMVTAMRS